MWQVLNQWENWAPISHARNFWRFYDGERKMVSHGKKSATSNVHGAPKRYPTDWGVLWHKLVEACARERLNPVHLDDTLYLIQWGIGPLDQKTKQWKHSLLVELWRHVCYSWITVDCIQDVEGTGEEVWFQGMQRHWEGFNQVWIDKHGWAIWPQHLNIWDGELSLMREDHYGWHQ